MQVLCRKEPVAHEEAGICDLMQAEKPPRTVKVVFLLVLTIALENNKIVYKSQDTEEKEENRNGHQKPFVTLVDSCHHNEGDERSEALHTIGYWQVPVVEALQNILSFSPHLKVFS